MNSALGFFLTMIAGAGVGVSMWPLKWSRHWKWGNFWLLYAIFSLILVPFCLAFAVLPHLAQVYSELPSKELVRPFLLGSLWGFAQLGAGISVHRLGLAVGGAVLNSIGAAFGTLLPVIFLHREEMFHSSGLLLLGGTLVMLVGAYLCGWSGYVREEEAKRKGRGAGFEREQTAMRQEGMSRSAYFISLGIAAGSGVLASLLNVALAYGGAITALVVVRGGNAALAPFAVWPIALLGGSLVNIAYAIYLISREKSWGCFRGHYIEVLFPLLAASLWMGGIAVYSSGTTYLGILGVSIGYAVFMIIMVISGQIAGVMTGEWSAMRASTYRSFFSGIAVLLVAVVMIGVSHYLTQ
jgi:L-rhamnose-H+ transport protein